MIPLFFLNSQPSALNFKEHSQSRDKKIPYRVEVEIKGSELLETRYEQIWSESPPPLENKLPPLFKSEHVPECVPAPQPDS